MQILTMFFGALHYGELRYAEYLSLLIFIE